MPESRYSASRAATVALLIAIVTAALLGLAGISYVREGESVGWVLVALAALAVIGGAFVRVRLRAGPD